MNPAFFILVILGTLVLWFLLAFIFRPLGKFVYKIIKDALDAMNDEEGKEL